MIFASLSSTETVIMQTGVGPVDGSEAEEISCKSRQKTCQMARVTGTQSQESGSEAASKLWGGAWNGGKTNTYCPFRIVGLFSSVSYFSCKYL